MLRAHAEDNPAKHENAKQDRGAGSLERARLRAVQKCFLAKARPEPDLRYCSNRSALVRSENPMQIESFQGLNFFV